MKENLAVIVDTGIGGGPELSRVLSEEGYQVINAWNTRPWPMRHYRKWPRDHYVHFDGRYVRRFDKKSEDPDRETPKTPKNYFGEGGYFRFGNGFLLVSDNISISSLTI